jgi:hypothetical protein
MVKQKKVVWSIISRAVVAADGLLLLHNLVIYKIVDLP